MKFCPVVPEICRVQVHVPKKERKKERKEKKNNNNNNKNDYEISSLLNRPLDNRFKK
jgi:hypothetical protein